MIICNCATIILFHGMKYVNYGMKHVFCGIKYVNYDVS